VSGVLRREARDLNERYAVAMAAGRPFVLLKAALTLGTQDHCSRCALPLLPTTTRSTIS